MSQERRERRKNKGSIMAELMAAEYRKAQKLIDTILRPKHFDLEKRFEEIKKENHPRCYVGKYMEKQAYAEWLEADEKTRKPGTKILVAELLDVDVNTLTLWKNKKEFKAMKRDLILAKAGSEESINLWLQSLMVQVALGNTKALEIFKNEFIHKRKTGTDAIKKDSLIEDLKQKAKDNKSKPGLGHKPSDWGTKRVKGDIFAYMTGQ